ncbi:glycerophosphodiester phosphodiesterase [Nocardiopsis sp. EMB25]|uniref:glycerophosphodiester phosphodiesterase n=1 Tax=Nocardiopsis sp. EMB25 TaxID=2835867 RepID=UPI0022847BC3|nr:glycerophosphodiester phosphodiesterase [Nocardiopsis sp. EMB25]MCY9785562.1 glycerophosphodiester phosphodiesterase [Nocardiopsis sp. EMB25]
MSQEDEHRDSPGTAPEGPERERPSGSGAPAGSGTPDGGGGWSAPGQGPAPGVPGGVSGGAESPGVAGPTAPPGRDTEPVRPAQYGWPDAQPGPAAGYGPPAAAPGYAPPGTPPGYGPQGTPPGYGPQGAPPGYGPQGHGYPGRPTAPKPGVVPLRPMTVGDLFNGAFALIRNNPKTTAGLAMIVVAVTSVISAVGFGGTMRDYGVFFDQALNDPASLDPAEPIPVSTWSIITTYGGALLSQAGYILVTGLLTAVVGLAVLGRRLTPGEAWAAIRDRLWTIVGLALIQLLIYFGLTLATALVGIVGVGVGAALLVSGAVEAGIAVIVLALVAVAACVCVFLWIVVRIHFAMPVVVLERVGVFASLARSWRLTRGSWWRVFGIILLTMLLVGLIGGLLTTPFTMGSLALVFLFPVEAWMPVASGALIYVGEVLINAFTTPFVVGVATLLYIDLRMRREGLDLRLHEAARAGHQVGPEVYLPEWRG